MKRRKFLKTSAVAAALGSLAAVLPSQAEENAKDEAREFYELRMYHLRRGPKQRLFDEFFEKAALPALGRAGVGPVGVFTVMTGPDSPTMFVLLPHKSAGSLVATQEALLADGEYLREGAEFLNAPATDPAYVRMESSFLRAFAGVPRVEVPERKARMFELRTYESHSKKANLKKIEMFNTGELEIFRRTGLKPVFFGETLVGARMPSLTYMLTFEDMAAHDRNWGAFIGDAAWKKLSTTPGYTDSEIVCNISNVFLRPTGYSQI